MMYIKICLVATLVTTFAYFSNAQNVITIQYIDQLDSIGKNAPGYPDTGKYVLDRDLDFNNPAHYSNGVIDSANHISAPGWRPIYFRGNFNGQNHTIKNVYINKVGIIGVNIYYRLTANYDNPNTYLSFFSIIESAAIVKNLFLSNIKYLTPNNYFAGTLQIGTGAGFAGLNKGIIENCGVNGQIEIDFASGGFVQTNIGTISSCYARIYFSNATSFRNDIYTNDRLGSNGGFVCLNAGLIQNSFSVPTYNANLNIYTTYSASNTNPGAFVGMAEGTYGFNYRYGARTSLIKNCYTISDRFSFVSVALQGSRFDSSYTNYLFNPTLFNSTNYYNTNAGVLNNCVSNADTLTSLTPLGNSKAYKRINEFLPLLNELNTQNGLKYQIDSFNVYFKYPDGNLVNQQYYLYDFRTNKSAKITPPAGYSFDSAFINNVFFTKDSSNGINILDNENLSDVVINLTNPIKLIRTVEALDSIGKYPQFPNTGAYQLANDIDFLNPLNYSTGIVNTQFTTGLGFTPINNFMGKFYGNNYKIKNLFIQQPNIDSIGLFKNLNGAYIENLIIPNANIIGNNTVGILASQSNNSKLIHCYVSGNIIGKNNVGGLVGINKKGVVIDCISKIKLIGDSNVGAMVGINIGNSAIKNSFVDANVTANFTGGLFAGVNDSSSIYLCYAWGAITGANIGGFLYKNATIGAINFGAISYCYTVTKNLPFIFIDLDAFSNNLVTGITLKNNN
ncbi:MAG: hypothetical protein ORN58_02135, partial [Sediminibacterium sp.]|nr:hypothetical protein [Sediminibacterium sp.]